jgi:hypothetical protein
MISFGRIEYANGTGDEPIRDDLVPRTGNDNHSHSSSGDG